MAQNKLNKHNEKAEMVSPRALTPLLCTKCAWFVINDNVNVMCGCGAEKFLGGFVFVFL